LNSGPREPSGLRGQFLLPFEVGRIKNILQILYFLIMFFYFYLLAPYNIEDLPYQYQ